MVLASPGNLSKRITVRRALLSSSECKQQFLGIVRCDAASRLGDSDWRTCRRLVLPRLALPQYLRLFRYGRFDPKGLGIEIIRACLDANSDGDTSNLPPLPCHSFCIHRHVRLTKPWTMSISLHCHTDSQSFVDNLPLTPHHHR